MRGFSPPIERFGRFEYDSRPRVSGAARAVLARAQFVCEAISLDYDVQRATRKCAKSGRELAPGETFYSVLMAEGAKVVRYDFAAEAWDGPADDALGWWKSQTPAAESKAKKPHWAPNDVMLQLFDELAERPDQADLRYVLALLLMRRRVLRVEEADAGNSQSQTLQVYCPRRQAEYTVAVATPDAARAEAIQQELAKLLLSEAA
jgi:hypothetical protein